MLPMLPCYRRLHFDRGDVLSSLSARINILILRYMQHEVSPTTPFSLTETALSLTPSLFHSRTFSLHLCSFGSVQRGSREKKGARRRGYLCYGELFSVFVLCMCPALPSHVPACVWTSIKLPVQPWQPLPWRQSGDGPGERLQVTEKETEGETDLKQRGGSHWR